MKSERFLVYVLACFLVTREQTCTVEGVLRILGGTFARPNEFQYVVGIGSFSDTGYGGGEGGGEGGGCTGGIIDEKFVLTAAHCLKKDSWMFVYSNTTNFRKDHYKTMLETRSGLKRTAPSTRRAVKAYVLSEYLTNGVADIAILELDSPLDLNDGYLQKLKLPTGRKISYEGAHVVLAGFGNDRLRHEDPDMNNGTLKKAHFQILSNSRCKNSRGITWARLCMIAVTEDDDYPDHPLGACHGDSGGPIVRENTVIGIMTSVDSYTCDGRKTRNERIIPQKSVKVRYYKNFINNVIGNRHQRLGDNQSITEYKLRA